MSGNPITEHMFPLCSIRYILNFHITHLPCRHSYHPLTTISPTTPPIFPPQSANSLRIFRQFDLSHFLCNLHKNFCTKNLKNTLFSPWFQGKKYIRKTPDYKQKLPKNFKFSTIFLDFKRKKSDFQKPNRFYYQTPENHPVFTCIKHYFQLKYTVKINK